MIWSVSAVKKDEVELAMIEKVPLIENGDIFS